MAGSLEPARAAAGEGADGLLIANTYQGEYINPHTKKHHLTNKTGGKSGRLVMEMTLPLVERVAEMRERGRYAFKIGGVGGITGAADVKRYMDAGADFVQLGSEVFYERPMEIKRKGTDGILTIREFLEKLSEDMHGGKN